VAKILDDGTRQQTVTTRDPASNSVEGPISSFSRASVTCCDAPSPPALSAEYRQDRTIELTVDRTGGSQGLSTRIEQAVLTGTLTAPDSAFRLFDILPPTATTTSLATGPQARVFFFRARSLVGSTLSPPSEVQRVIVLGLKLPPMPANFTAELDGPVVALAWDIDPVAASYRLDRLRPGIDTDWDFVASTGFNPSFPVIDPDVQPETLYRYRLTPANQQGEGPPAFVDVTTSSETTGLCSAYTLDLTTPIGPLPQGVTGGSGVRVSPIGGFSGQVRFDLEGPVQAFESVTLTPAIDVPQSLGAGLSMTAGLAQPPGNYDFTIRATSGAALCTLEFTVQVVAGEE
jgi:hypothetical protein